MSIPKPLKSFFLISLSLLSGLTKPTLGQQPFKVTITPYSINGAPAIHSLLLHPTMENGYLSEEEQMDFMDFFPRLDFPQAVLTTQLL